MSSAYTPSTQKLYKNENAINWRCSDEIFLSTKYIIKDFHTNMEQYQPSNLIKIPNAHGIELFVKEESDRFSLPSFKILGASWGVFRCLVEKFKLTLSETKLSQLKRFIQEEYPHLTLVAATDGNHGRAVAYMAKLLDLKSRIFVPRNVLDTECDKIRQENKAELTRIDGNYDDAIAASFQFYSRDVSTHVLIQDFAFEGYVNVPTWIAHGYSTLCSEIPFSPNVVFIPCGAGCFAQGVTTYYRSFDSRTRIFLAEPNTAYAVNKSLILHKPSSDPGTSMTIMDGLNCPTISQTAFPVLQRGVSFSGLVSDKDCSDAVAQLKELGVNSGPCGAVTYAAFLSHIGNLILTGEVQRGDKIVLVSTEAYRKYHSFPNM